MPARSPRNFRAYAAIEALNILLVPGAVLLLAPPASRAEALATGLAIAACAGFLLVGAVYWAALGQRLAGSDRLGLNKALSLADRLEWPLLLLTGAAGAASVFALMEHGGWSWPIVGAAVLAVLAVLEYVNYYHRQLQHFDRWRDFKRLVNRRRLPRAHMARDLAAYRRQRA